MIFLGPLKPQSRYLDIGGDNGVICYLLRQQGGEWRSADLSADTVQAIEAVIGEKVEQIDASGISYEEDSFDCIVIIDFLEHIEEDQQFVRELHRILKPGGQLIVNVPHHKSFSLIRKIRLAVGLSDEKHGHVRPGYSKQSLANTLQPLFEIEAERTYSGFFYRTLRYCTKSGL